MKAIAELPGLTWTESVNPSFAEIKPQDILQRIVKHYGLRRMRDRRIRQTDAEPLRAAHRHIKKIADQEDFLFVQIGAHNGMYDDEFRQYLKEYPWRAILVEPQAQPYNQLAALYADRANTSTIQAAIASEPGAISLWKTSLCEDIEFGTAIASTNIEQVKKEIKRCLGGKALRHSVIAEESVPAITASDMLSTANAKASEIDLFVCDTEGQDAAIANQLLDLGASPQALQYEHLHAATQEVEELDDRLTKKGYSLIKPIRIPSRRLIYSAGFVG